MNISQTLDNVKNGLERNSPQILLGIGVAGMLSSTVMAIRATPKALSLIEDEKKKVEMQIKSETGDSVSVKKLALKDTVKVTWKCYIPSAITAGISIACLIGSSSISHKRYATLATAYAISDSAFRTYKRKVEEVVGAKNVGEIRNAVAKEKVEKNPVASKEVVITSTGETLCYDALSGRYFKSDIEKLKKVQNELNRRMRDEMFISLNEYYYEIGLSGIKVGDDLGWNIETSYIDMEFSSQLTSDGTPCLVVDYLVGPEYDYRQKSYF